MMHQSLFHSDPSEGRQSVTGWTKGRKMTDRLIVKAILRRLASSLSPEFVIYGNRRELHLRAASIPEILAPVL
jgi:hypothetical protein